MIVTLTLPDALYAAYLEHSKTNPVRAMMEALKRFQEFKPEDRTVFLTKAQQRRLEGIVKMALDEAGVDKMIDQVEELVSLEADKVKINLSEGFRKRLRSEAQHFRKEYPVYVKEYLTRTILDREG
jgi:hypothetical protein